MLVPLTRESPGHWSYHSATDQVTTPGNQAQPKQLGWLVGDLKAQAEAQTRAQAQGRAQPALWAKYPCKPSIEEFVPRNPPQALGEGKEKMLAWPTSALYGTAPPYSDASGSRQNGEDETSPMRCQSFFRNLVVKGNREASENAEWKPGSRSSVNDVGSILRDVSQDFVSPFDQRSPSAGTISGDSYRAQSSGTSLGKR